MSSGLNGKSSRREKIRLVKDLEEGENKLCQSLVDIKQFQSVDQMFSMKKQQFHVIDQQIDIPEEILVEEEKNESDMTPAEKLQIYRKLKIKQKYRERYENIVAQKKDDRIFKIRKPQIPVILHHFNEKAKDKGSHNETKYSEEIKVSEEKLRFVRSYGKISNKAAQQPETQSSKYLKETRCRFYSLKSGMPQKQQKLFPTYAEYVEGKNRAKMLKKFKFDIDHVANSLSTFYTEVNPQANPIKSATHKRKMSVNKQKLGLSFHVNQKSKVQPIPSQRAQTSVSFRQKQIFNTEPLKLSKGQRDFHSSLYFYSENPIAKSEKTSKSMVKTMSKFYTAKSKKYQQYDNMVEYYEHDRPLSNSIRRAQYGISIRSQKTPRQKNKGLMQCRNRSESERKRILNLNSKNYERIVALLTNYHEDDIPVALQFLERLRALMNRQYQFSEDEVRLILDELISEEARNKKKKSEYDITSSDEQQQVDRMFKVEEMLQILNKGFNFALTLQ